MQTDVSWNDEVVGTKEMCEIIEAASADAKEAESATTETLFLVMLMRVYHNFNHDARPYILL